MKRLKARPSVAEMADSVGLSESWFTHVFKNTTGQTPLQWQLAQRMLMETDLKLAEVAAQMGLSDQERLTRVFRQRTTAFFSSGPILGYWGLY